jgi:ribosomal protein S18 acetylase RimI-like enzyme
VTAVVIAVAGEQHAGEVLTVQRAAYVTEAQRYGDPFLPPLTQSLGELVQDVRAGRRLVALRGHRVVGAIRGEECHGLLHVGRLAVAPDQQGAGIGTGLLLAVETLAGPAVTAFALFTGADSEANLRLYQGLGYRQVRHEPLPHGSGLTHLEKPRRSPGSGAPN